MTLHNYQIWTDIQNLKQQYDFDFGSSLPWKEKFYQWLGNPFVLFQIRDCLIEILQEHVMVNEPQPLYTCIVWIEEEIYHKLEKNINASSEQIPELISRWLTEQVGVYGNNLNKNLPGLSVLLRVARIDDGLEYHEDEMEEDEHPYSLDIVKSDQFQNDKNEYDFLQNKRSFVFTQWMRRKLFSPKISPPRFWVRFPKKGARGSYKTFLEVIVPVKLKDNIFVDNSGWVKLGRNFFMDKGMSEVSQLFLISDDHIEMTSTTILLDEEANRTVEQIWIRHIGGHEVWVHQFGWKPVSRSAWMPVSPGNLIVLGRVVEEPSQKFVIVPGSMVLKVGEKGGDNRE